MKALYIVLIAVFFLSACGPSPADLTATAVMAQAQTQTAAPTNTPPFTPTVTLTSTPTVTSTATPKPTSTLTPTPAAIGDTVQTAHISLEITVLSAKTHSHIVPGGSYYFYANKGYTFVELTARVTNTGDKPISIHMKGLYLLQDTDHSYSYYPKFSGIKAVKLDQRADASSIALAGGAKEGKTNTGDEDVTFEVEKVTYLRMIFYVPDKHDFLFGILNSPPILVDVKDK